MLVGDVRRGYLPTTERDIKGFGVVYRSCLGEGNLFITYLRIPFFDYPWITHPISTPVCASLLPSLLVVCIYARSNFLNRNSFKIRQFLSRFFAVTPAPFSLTTWWHPGCFQVIAFHTYCTWWHFSSFYLFNGISIFVGYLMSKPSV